MAHFFFSLLFHYLLLLLLLSLCFFFLFLALSSSLCLCARIFFCHHLHRTVKIRLVEVKTCRLTATDFTVVTTHELTLLRSAPSIKTAEEPPTPLPPPSKANKRNQERERETENKKEKYEELTAETRD